MSTTPHRAQPSADAPVEHTTSVEIVHGDGFRAECAGCGWKSQVELWSHQAQRLGRLHREAMARARVHECQGCLAEAVNRGLALPPTPAVVPAGQHETEERP